MALVDYYNTGDVSAANITSVSWYAQTFTASKDYDCSSIKVKMYRGATPPTTVYCELWGTSASKPSGGALDTASVIGSTLSEDTGGTWIEFTFSSPVSLTNGVLYAIVMYPTAGAGFSWRADTAPTSAPGYAYIDGSDGSSWGTARTYDLMYETYESDVTYSELSGDCAGVGAGSGDLELNTYSALAGTCAVVGGGSGDLGSTLVYTSGYVTYRRLIAVGNNQIWYEDI